MNFTFKGPCIVIYSILTTLADSQQNYRMRQKEHPDLGGA